MFENLHMRTSVPILHVMRFSAMLLELATFLSLLVSLEASKDLSFTYNGFQSGNLSLDGIAEITPSGLLKLTNDTLRQTSHAFFPNPIKFNHSSGGSVMSFSTTFVFAIVPSQYPTLAGHGLAFVIAPTRNLPESLASQYLGIFNDTNINLESNHVVAVELDTFQNTEFDDINGNHVGIDINGLTSIASAPPAYYDDSTKELRNLTLISGKAMQLWVEYGGLEKHMNVTIAPMGVRKPSKPLISHPVDLSPILKDTMFVGFSTATSNVRSFRYISGWSFRMNGQAQELNLSQLPKVPRVVLGPKKVSKLLTIGLPVILGTLAAAGVLGVVYYTRRKQKFAELLEDWELDYGPHRFKYKDLYTATKGFKDKELLGTGGFGRVYRGVLKSSKTEIAVKRISHDSAQGMKEFVAEIVSMGRLGHRNLVPLLGYCRRKGELLLVYDYMPNGSLDKYIHNNPKLTLNWNQRFRVIKGVASGLLYLHEEWEQVVIHRDVKASNVLLDGEWNGRLGDFGLAKLYDHGTNPKTTRVVGTLGYIAPEQTRRGRATTTSDIFAFGIFLLEVACGRRPVDPRAPIEDLILVDSVLSCWIRGNIIEARDPKLGEDYIAEELALVLKLGLLCSHINPAARPSMRQVGHYLEGDCEMPELTSLDYSGSGLNLFRYDGFTGIMSYPSSSEKAFTDSRSLTESILSGGR